jgi:hypothetical protein
MDGVEGTPVLGRNANGKDPWLPSSLAGPRWNVDGKSAAVGPGTAGRFMKFLRCLVGVRTSTRYAIVTRGPRI